jgi:hypothetical protein
MKRLWLAIVGFVGVGVSLALAQDAGVTLSTGRELLSRPSQYLNRAVTIASGYCFFDDTKTMTYTCIGKEMPFEVEARSIPEGPAQNAIKASCGDIQGIEHNPSKYCAFSFKFRATSYKTVTGDYVLHDLVQSNKRIVHFDATILEPYK